MSWYGIGSGHNYIDGPDGKGWIFLLIMTLYLFSAGPLINIYGFDPYKVHITGITLIILSLYNIVRKDD